MTRRLGAADGEGNRTSPRPRWVGRGELEKDMANEHGHITTEGPLFDPGAGLRMTAISRNWLQIEMKFLRTFARSIAPVKTGQYQRSIVFRTLATAAGAEGRVFSNYEGTPAEVIANVIEFGSSRGHRPRRVFGRTFDAYHAPGRAVRLGAMIAQNLSR